MCIFAFLAQLENSSFFFFMNNFVFCLFASFFYQIFQYFHQVIHYSIAFYGYVSFLIQG